MKIVCQTILSTSLLLAAGNLCAAPLSGQDSNASNQGKGDETKTAEVVTELPSMNVSGQHLKVTDALEIQHKLDLLRLNHSGSVSTVGPDEINLQNSSNIGDILARVPGINFVDESGNGTKPNIGMRGLNPIRSSFTQILRDGVPTQPSVYSDPAAYHGVPTERIGGIEVIKGGASIIQGPNAVGGVINYLSKDPSPEKFSGVLDAQATSNDDFSGNLRVSGTVDDTAYSVDYLKKDGHGFGEGRDIKVDDIEASVAHQFNKNNNARLRLQYYNEESHTPGGLLPEQFAQDNKQSNKPNDVFYGTRIGADLKTNHQLLENQSLETLTYAYSYERNWYLQNYVNNNTPDLTLADTNGQYLRKFYVYGFEPKYHVNFDTDAWQDNQVTFGGRVYYDQVDNRSLKGNSGTAREGDLQGFKKSSTTAYAGYIQAELNLTKKLTLTPGLRYEHIKQTTRNVVADTAEQSTNYNVLLPGLGLTYKLDGSSVAYANISKAFRPPTSGQSFNPAIVVGEFDLDSSKAWTYETGVRLQQSTWFSADLGVFYTQFDDQLIISAGTADTFDTTQYGFEGTADIGLLDLAEVLSGTRFVSDIHLVNLELGATVVDSSFENGEFEGNDTPYAPDLSVTFGLRYSYDTRYDLVFQGRYLAEQFTDNANTIASNDIGTVGKIGSYTVYDLKARWQASDKVVLNIGVNNLFDESYGTQRRSGFQKGLYAGVRRTATASVTLAF